MKELRGRHVAARQASLAVGKRRAGREALFRCGLARDRSTKLNQSQAGSYMTILLPYSMYTIRFDLEDLHRQRQGENRLEL